MSAPARPEVTAPPAWSFPEPQVHDLDNGLHVLTYDVPGQYVLSVRLGLPVSLTEEPEELEGVATIVARTMDEGTAEHSAEEFAQLLERRGINYGAGISEVGLSIDLDVVKGQFAPAMDLLHQLITGPVFPEAEVRRQVRTRIAEIEQETAVAASRGGQEFIRTYYAPTDRASRPTAGSRESVSRITREDVVAFHAEHVRAAGTTVVVAGDLTDLDVPGILEETLGRWEAGAPRERHLDREMALASDRGRIVLVDRPGSVQTEFLIGAPGPDRSVPIGWSAYPVLGFILGGSPSARIDDVLREEKGYTYGIRSGFRPRHRGGLFLTSGSVRADSTPDALRLLVEILEAGRAGFTPEEVRAGVDFIAKTAPGRYATADAVADEAVGMALDGRSTKFTTQNLRQLATLDVERVNLAYTSFLAAAGIAGADQPAGSGWTVIAVGDAAAHADAIRDLGLGEVTVIRD